MKKIINQPDNYIKEMLEGIYIAHKDDLTCVDGDVFQSPSVDQAIALTRDADQGAGVLYIYGNYNGDIFTFRPAADEVEMEDDIETAEVLGADDVASAGPSAPGEKSTRRGVAAGKAMANKVPSTMGSLMATGLKQAGKDLKGKEALEDADVVQIFASYEAGVAKLGGAKVASLIMQAFAKSL